MCVFVYEGIFANCIHLDQCYFDRYLELDRFRNTHSELPFRYRKSPASRLFTQSFIQTQIKENIKAPRHWPLCGDFTGDRWITHTNGQLRGKCFHSMTSSWPVDSPHKGQWRGTLMFSLISARTNGWANTRDAGDLRCHRTHYNVTIIWGQGELTP